jgi:3-isopropylmalate/(R)-2-methylmalate dehydratase small subunit
MENLTTGEKYSLRPLGEVVPILEAGGVFPYARSKGMLPA